MQLIATTFPNLTSLVWRDSTVPDLNQLFPSFFQALESLNLSNCGIESWDQVASLQALPHLSTLKLCENPISLIPELHPNVSIFPSLKLLNIEDSGINLLPSLHHLNLFPALTDLRITNTPLNHRFKDQFRMIVIAYLPRIVQLNGARLEGKERITAERNFIREFSASSGSEEHADFDAPQDTHPLVHYLDPAELLTNREVFQRLFGIHGKVHKFAEISLAPPTEAMLHLQTEEGEVSSATFSLKSTVRNLKQTCETLFGIPVDQQKLFYGDHEMLQIVGLDWLRFDNKTLGGIGMKDDDIIVVARKEGGGIREVGNR